MSLGSRLSDAAKNTNKPALLAGLLFAGTYALGLVFERRERVQAVSRQARAVPAPVASPVTAPLSGWAAFKAFSLRLYTEINDDRLLALAAGVVFYALLALFPAITALVSSYALFARPSTILEHMVSLADVMPAGAFKIVNEQVMRVVSRGGGELSFAFAFGLALALWSANAGIKAIIDALNIVYDEEEERGFVTLNLVSLGFTVGAIVVFLLAIFSVGVLPVIFSFVGATENSTAILAWLRWPALMLMLYLGISLLYRLGPDRKCGSRCHWFTPGALFAVGAWLAGSALLSWYLASFADYDATYGSLGAGIGLMMWLWMSAIAVLVGAQINSILYATPKEEKRPFPKAGPDRMGGL